MANTARQVSGVSYASERSPVGYVVSKDHVFDFGVYARVVGAKTDPDGTTVKDRRGFTLINSNNEFVLNDVVVRFPSDCGVKFDVLRVDFNNASLSNIAVSSTMFYGFVVSVTIYYEEGEEYSTVLFTQVFDMTTSSEQFEVRDLPGFKASAGGKLYAFIRAYSVNSDIPSTTWLTGNVSVTGTYRYQSV